MCCFKLPGQKNEIVQIKRTISLIMVNKAVKESDTKYLEKQLKLCGIQVAILNVVGTIIDGGSIQKRGKLQIRREINLIVVHISS